MTAVILALSTGVDTSTYRVILLLHLLTAIVGFGGVLLNGAYAAQAAARPGPTGRAVSEANEAVTAIADRVIWLVPLTGLALVWASDGAWQLGDTWLWASLALFAVAAAASRLLLSPGHHHINRLLAEAEGHAGEGPPPQLAEVERLGRRQAVTGVAVDLVMVAILVLMVWRPGT